jgi:hypothetical protein
MSIESHISPLSPPQESKPLTLTLEKINSFLIQNFNFGLKTFMSTDEIPVFLLPMIVEVSNPNWTIIHPNCIVFHQSDDMVGLYGPIEILQLLDNDPEVLSVEPGDE